MSHCARCQYTGDLEQHTEDAEHPLCCVCQRRSLTIHERQTCGHCIGRTRANLADIENLASRLPGVLVENRLPNTAATDRTGGSHEPAMLGGDALAMLAPGGAGWDNSRRVTTSETKPEVEYPDWTTHDAYVRGATDGIIGREHVVDELPEYPPSVEGLLAVHEDDWRHQLRHPAAGPPTISGSVAYLNEQLERMAQAYSEFDSFAQDIHNLKTRLQAVVGLSEQPVRGADCFDCGTRLVRRYRYKGDQLKPAYNSTQGPGLEDNWTCERCERVYSPAEYWLAVRAALEQQQQQDTA